MQFQKHANGARAFMGNFLCGLKKVKRFVEVHLHYMFRNLKKDKRNVDIAPPGKISADAHGCHRMENVVLEIWFLIIQLKKSTLGCARTLSEASWLSILEDLSHSFEVFHSHSSCCCQQGTGNLAEGAHYPGYCRRPTSQHSEKS